MLGFVSRLLLGSRRPSAARPARARLGLEAFESRLVPASVTFADGVLFVQADQATNDLVAVVPAGAARDGSTGVTLITNVTGAWQVQTFGGAGAPVTNIALDMKDGNDVVSVASLRATVVAIGQGNGNNVVLVGDTRAGGVIAGTGRNVIALGGGSTNPFGSFSFGDARSGSAAFVGWGYEFRNGGREIFTSGNAQNNANDNVVLMSTRPGQTSITEINGSGNNYVLGGRGSDLVSVNGNGNNFVFLGAGDDRTIVNGNGNNTVHVGAGNDRADVTGNGNNSVTARGTGSVTVNGGGQNRVNAGTNAGVTVALNGAGAGSTITASALALVFVNGTQVTASGTVGNVVVTLV